MLFLTLESVNAPFHKVRLELEEVGLLRADRYLDKIDLSVAYLPSMGELGYVYDESVSWLHRLVGYEPGRIYLPRTFPGPRRQLCDVIRHEFAHAWRWLDPAFIRKPWFRQAFGGKYEASWSWDHGPGCDPDSDEFVTTYAGTRPAEDFAEMFMTFLRCRKSLEQFRGRKGVYRKLMAVKKAVRIAARERVGRRGTGG